MRFFLGYLTAMVVLALYALHWALNWGVVLT